MLALKQHGLDQPDLDRDICGGNLAVLVDLDTRRLRVLKQLLHSFVGRGLVHVVERVHHFLGNGCVGVHQDMRYVVQWHFVV